MTSITIEELSKTIGNQPILHDIDLSIGAGKLVALLGPSGCGKSTLLRLIAGLDAPTSGRIRFNGRDVTDVPPQARNIAMVFQSYALYPHMTVRENMAYGLKQRKLPAAEISARIENTARILHLEPYLDRRPKQLSGGQRQRVAMGRAIVREPVAFLMDEPLSNLDAQLRQAMRLEIRALQRQLAVTTLYVTHDQVEAVTMSDRVVLMNAGRILQEGAPLDLYDRPANLFVARFIGLLPMNLFDVTRVEGGLRAGDGTILPAAAGSGAETFTAGLRPEHIAIHPGPEDAKFTAVVTGVQHLGGEVEIYVEALGERFCVRAFDRDAPAAGERVVLGYAPQRLHLFDKETGVRVPALYYSPAEASLIHTDAFL
jgi:ABC-type sugar transport system ATPase subunit